VILFDILVAHNCLVLDSDFRLNSDYINLNKYIV